MITPKENTKLALFESLEQGNISNLKTIFHSFFASIPHDWYRKNQLAGYEAYYVSIFYYYFTAIGLDVRPEDPTYDKYSLHRRDKFEKLEREIYLIGVEFSKLERNITNLEWEKLES